MEEMLGRLALHSVQFIGKAAFGTASSLAMKQVSSYISNQKAAHSNVKKLSSLQEKFEVKIAMVSPSIDLVEIIAARGNSALQGVVMMSSRLRKDIDKLTNRIASIIGDEDATTGVAKALEPKGAIVSEQNALERELIDIIEKIEDLVPYLNLALTASGANLAAGLPRTVSPGRLMQASSYLTETERCYASAPDSRQRVGNPFRVKLYSMFQSSARKKSLADYTWAEEFVKCDAICERFSGVEPRAYELVITENMNDGRFHEELDGKSIQKTDFIPGRKKIIDVNDIQRMYYSSSGQLLNIGDSKTPVLVLKVVRGTARKREGRPLSSAYPSTPDDRGSNPDWYAIGLDMGDDEIDQDSDGEEEEDDEDKDKRNEDDTVEPGDDSSKSQNEEDDAENRPRRTSTDAEFTTSPDRQVTLSALSLLEYILRLSALEVCEQASHLDVVDEKLNLFLRDNEVTREDVAAAATSLAKNNTLSVVPLRLDAASDRLNGSPIPASRNRIIGRGTPTRSNSGFSTPTKSNNVVNRG